MPSNSSIMRQRIVLQERTLTANEFNEQVPGWVDTAVLPGAFEPLVGREYFSNAALPQKDAQIDAKIRIRLRKGINPAKHMVVHGGIVYDIISVIYDRERQQAQLMVRARATDQNDGSTVNV